MASLYITEGKEERSFTRRISLIRWATLLLLVAPDVYADVSTNTIVVSTPTVVEAKSTRQPMVYYVGNGRFDDGQGKIQTYEIGTRVHWMGGIWTEHLVGTFFEVDGNVTTAITFHSIGYHYDIKKLKGFWIEGFSGVGALSKPDPRLGGHFQFTELGTVGYKRFGLSYQHISSAGIYKVNTGRDFILGSYRF